MSTARKIIQVATIERDQTIPELVALCDDGTLWRANLMRQGYSMNWGQIQSVPQPPPKNGSMDLTESE